MQKLSEWCFDTRKGLSKYGWDSEAPTLSSEEIILMGILDYALAKLQAKANFREWQEKNANP